MYINVERHGDGDRNGRNWQWSSGQTVEWREEKELHLRASGSQVPRSRCRSVKGRVWHSVCNKPPRGCRPGGVCAWLCAWSVRRSGVSAGWESGQVSRRPVTPWPLSVRSVVSRSSWWTEGGHASHLREQRTNPDFPLMFQKAFYLVRLSLTLKVLIPNDNIVISVLS